MLSGYLLGAHKIDGIGDPMAALRALVLSGSLAFWLCFPTGASAQDAAGDTNAIGPGTAVVLLHGFGAVHPTLDPTGARTFVGINLVMPVYRRDGARGCGSSRRAVATRGGSMSAMSGRCAAGSRQTGRFPARPATPRSAESPDLLLVRGDAGHSGERRV